MLFSVQELQILNCMYSMSTIPPGLYFTFVCPRFTSSRI